MKWMKPMLAILCCLLAAGGCSTVEEAEEDVKKTTEDVAESLQKGVGKSVKDSEKTLDDMMEYLEGQGVELTHAAKLDSIEFAAYDGRCFEVDGNMVYLYRIDTEDEQMKQMMSQLKKTGRVQVQKDGQTMEYNGVCKDDYLLLYDTNTQIANLPDIMDRYSSNADKYTQSGENNVSETTD